MSDRTCYSDNNLVVVSLLLRAICDQSRFLEAEGIVTEFSQTPEDAEPSVTRVRVERIAKRDH